MPFERWPVAVLLLVGVACNHSNHSNQAASASAATQGATPASPRISSHPVTPQSIVKDLFPNAPEKARDLACFRSLKPEMSVYAVVQKCGRPDEEIGSGLYVFVYHLQDGSTVGISTPDLAKAGHITGVDKKGRTFITK